MVFAFEAGVDANGGDAGGLRLANDLAQAGLVERREQDAVDAAGDHVLNDGDLLFAVVFLLRPFPDDLDAEFLTGFDCAGVERFPVLVGGPHGDDGDGASVGVSVRAAAAAAESEESHAKEEKSPHVGQL